MAGEMKETADKTAPCGGAITEKKANRPGGCVGIFFQLFDWNRRFAKKKLFSRKSLLPGGAKQTSKRFGGNEKMPKSKLHLIADENRGGFPNLKRNEVMEPKKHEMKSPGLVARLMGLESMPAIHRDKPKKKSSLSQIDKNVEKDELVGKCNVFNREEESCLEKSRPQKIQKTTTGVCDRRMVKRIGSEALQIKNVLIRARKHHQHRHHQHQKLASPVKSPRLYRRSSRLIDAAARILEPGLQAKNKGKCAITYSGSRTCENVATDPVEVAVSLDSLDLQRGCYHVASCKNCGSLVDVLGSRLVVDEMGKNMAKVSESSSPDKKGRNVFSRKQEQSLFVAAKGIESDRLTDANHSATLHSDSHGLNNKHHKHEMMSPGFRNRNEAQNQLLQRERFPPEARSCPLWSTRVSSSAANAVNRKDKDFAPMNGGATSRICPRIPSKVENSDSDLQRKFHTRQEDSATPGLSIPAGKRRIACISKQGQGAGFVRPTSRKSEGSGTFAGNKAGGSRESIFVPSKLSSPLRGSDRSCRESKERKWGQRDLNPTGESHLKAPLQKTLPLDGDTIRLLLQQKLKELASQQEDETIREGDLSTSTILQEIISALAVEQTFSEKTDIPDAGTAYGSKGKRELWSSLGYVHNGDYMSPGSVLEASFSNESCFSSSFDDSPGQMRLPLEPTYHQLNPSEPDEELLEDSATSIKKPIPTKYQWIRNLINHTSNVLHTLNHTGLRTTLHKFTNAREAIIHTELLSGTTQEKDFLICPKLVDELMIHAAGSEIPIYLPGFSRGFLVDAMIEYLDLRYCEHVFLGSKRWRALPLSLNADTLIRQVLEEVRKWTEFAGMSLDQIIEIEMEKWWDLDTDASELGAELAFVILQGLVGEITVDILAMQTGKALVNRFCQVLKRSRFG